MSCCVLAVRAVDICSKIPGLTREQRLLCESRPDLVAAIGEGTRLGVAECQRQFKHHRWNCTAIGSVTVFGHVVVVGKFSKFLLIIIISALLLLLLYIYFFAEFIIKLLYF